ncbi:hypothetical protein OEZ86_004662 [Tetradesmus obliquus]|nr:hypothetical protein OEZ86_004662 [Tetradesmus obliquus]
MAPKKKPGKKEDGLSDKELLQKAEAELLSLRRLLELKTFEVVDARKLEKSWRQRAEMAEAALEQARLDTADIRADMARQHNSTQDHLSSRVTLLEGRQAELAQQLEAAAAANEALTATNIALKQAAQEQAAGHQRQVEALQREFAAMLKDTLDKMHARLEQQHSSSMTAAHKGSTAAAGAAAVPWKPAG